LAPKQSSVDAVMFSLPPVMSEFATNVSPTQQRGRCQPRRAVVVVAGSVQTSERFIQVVTQSLDELGVDATFLGREGDAALIAAAVVAAAPDSVELCLAGGGGVVLLRELLHELIAVGRRDVSIVVHKEL
jgi:methylmalonyl-CoA mutase cobalamin-binding subunit